MSGGFFFAQMAVVCCVRMYVTPRRLELLTSIHTTHTHNTQHPAEREREQREEREQRRERRC